MDDTNTNGRIDIADIMSWVAMKTKASSLSEEERAAVWESDFTFEEFKKNGTMFDGYQKLKEACKPVQKSTPQNQIAELQGAYEYSTYKFEPTLDEFMTDCAYFGVEQEDFILSLLALKVSTLVNVGEAPVLQISGDSGAGKSFGKLVVSTGFGYIPAVFTSQADGETFSEMRLYKSLSSMGGTPMVAVYSTDNEDKAAGMIMDFDDQRNVSDTTCQIFLQCTNVPFMEAGVYKSVVNLQVEKKLFAVNQRFVLTAVHLPKVLLDAGLNTRCLKVDVTKQDEYKMQCAILGTTDLEADLKRMAEKWSEFWTNLYVQVYFKGARCALVMPDSYCKFGEATFLNLGSNRAYQHLKAITAVYALFRDPQAIYEGRNLVATEEEVQKAVDFIRAHAMTSMQDTDSPLSGDWVAGSADLEIAEKLSTKKVWESEAAMQQFIRDYIMSADASETVKKLRGKNMARTGKRIAAAFIKQECAEGALGSQVFIGKTKPASEEFA